MNDYRGCAWIVTSRNSYTSLAGYQRAPGPRASQSLHVIYELLSNQHLTSVGDHTTVWEKCESHGATSQMQNVAAETETEAHRMPGA